MQVNQSVYRERFFSSDPNTLQPGRTFIRTFKFIHLIIFYCVL